MKKLLEQFVRFVGISGLGWLIDFSLYTLLTAKLGVSVFFANILSSLPAITLVFFVSTRKIFRNSPRVPLWVKYALYVGYQLVLLLAVSTLAQGIAAGCIRLFGAGIAPLAPIMAKILITPCTMVCNFGVMKIMTEKM